MSKFYDQIKAALDEVQALHDADETSDAAALADRDKQIADLTARLSEEPTAAEKQALMDEIAALKASIPTPPTP